MNAVDLFNSAADFTEGLIFLIVWFVVVFCVSQVVGDLRRPR